MINLDAELTVNLGSAASQLPLPLGPLASVTVTAPVWAAAPGGQLQVGLVPGGSAYSPGALTITGPVTAEITGPVDAVITGTADVNVTNATIDIIGGGGYVVPGQTGEIYANSAAWAIAAGAVATEGPFDVSTYASVDFSFGALSNSSAASGSAMCAVVTFQWADTNGTPIGTDTISVCQGQYAVGSTPCQGVQLTVSVYNPGSVGTLSFASDGVLVDGSFRTVGALKFTSVAQSAPSFSGLTVLAQREPVGAVNGWLANINTTGLTAGDVYMWLLPMYNGAVSGLYQIVTDALDNAGVIIDLAFATVGSVIAGTGNNALLQSLPSAVQAAAVPVSFIAPPSQLAFVAKPSNTATAVVLTLTGQG